MQIGSRFTVVATAALLTVGCDRASAPPSMSPEAHEGTPAAATPSAATQPLLDGLQGDWAGQYTLTWMDPEKSAFSEEPSEGSASVTEDRIEYTWVFRGETQSGTIELRRTETGVQTSFTDTWHTPDGKPLESNGVIEGELVNVLAQYGGDAGPPWGWRTEIELGTSDALTVRMYNITPDGQEMIAVNLVYTRPK